MKRQQVLLLSVTLLAWLTLCFHGNDVHHVKQRYSKIPQVSIAIGDVSSASAAARRSSPFTNHDHHRRMDRASAALSEGLDPAVTLSAARP